MQIIAIDPGLATGMCGLRPRDDRSGLDISFAGEYSPMETGDTLDHVLRDRGDEECVIVIERFVISRSTASNSQAPWSLEIIGNTRWLSHTYLGTDQIVLQTPSDAKSLVTNERIKNLGLWQRGSKGHVIDAIRHGVLYSVRAKLLDPRALA